MATTNPGTHGAPRHRLGREAVLRAALDQADASGLEGLSMRKLAEVLEFAPMALYRHVSSKDDLIDGMVDLVFAEIHLPAARPDWRAEQRRRAVSVRDVLARHRWAIGLMESRSHPGPASLRHHDAVLGSLRAGGFDLIGAAHAYSAIDSYVYGFALTKMNLPFESGEEVIEVAETMLEPFSPDAYPNLVEFIAGVAMQPGYDYANEFEYGLDLILDGLEAGLVSGCIEVAETMLEPFSPDAYPNLVEFIAGVAMQPGYDYANEFEYGLDLILDGLEAGLVSG